jgi:hypothetical protein
VSRERVGKGIGRYVVGQGANLWRSLLKRLKLAGGVVSKENDELSIRVKGTRIGDIFYQGDQDSNAATREHQGKSPVFESTTLGCISARRQHGTIEQRLASNV